MTRSSMLAQALSIGTIAGSITLMAACGGKILDDGSVTATTGPGGSPTGTVNGGPGATSGSAPGTPSGSPSGGPTTGPTPPKSTAPIACGGASCDGATQECCITVGGGPGGGGSTSSAGGPPTDPTSATCTPKGKCGGDIALSCSSAASCTGGQVCCANLNADAPTAKCQPACGAGGGTGGGGGGQGGTAQLCASDKECPKGRTCQDSQAGFKFCRRPGGGGGGGGGASSNGGP